MFFSFVAACGGTNLVDQFMANQAADSGALEVQSIQHLHDGTAGEITAESTKVFTNDLGYEVTLEMAELHFHAIRLLSSGADPECLGGLDQEVMLHSTFDLMGEDLFTHHLGTASIPRAAYCEFDLELGSSSEAMVKFDHADEMDPGHTEGYEGDSPAFYLMGHWSKDDASGNFEYVGNDPVELHKIFQAKEDGVVIDHPLHFHEGEGLLTVLIGTKYDLLFEGVDFVDHEVSLDQIYENLDKAVHQHTGDHHGSSTDAGSDHQH